MMALNLKHGHETLVSKRPVGVSKYVRLRAGSKRYETLLVPFRLLERDQLAVRKQNFETHGHPHKQILHDDI